MARGTDTGIGGEPDGVDGNNGGTATPVDGGGNDLGFSDVTSSDGVRTVDFAKFANGSGSGSASGADAGDDAPRRRGRKPGSKNRDASEKASPSVASISSLLFSVHMMLSISLQTPELVLTDDESKMLASAMAAVAKQHPDVIDPKKAAYVQLAVAIGVVYGSRVIAIRGRKSRDKSAARNAEQTSSVSNVASLFGGAPVG